MTLQKGIFLFLVFLLSARSIAETLSCESEIQAVTVYQKGAQVNRTASVDIQQGNSELVLTNLSSFLVEDSWQIDLGPDVELISVSRVNDYLIEEEANATYDSLQDSLKITSRERKVLQANIATLQGEQKLITENGKLSDKTTVKISAEVEALADFYRKRMTALSMDILELQERMAEVDQVHQRLQRQMNQESKGRRKSISKLVLQISSDRTVTREVSFSYQISSAGWHPHYELRSDGVDSEVALTYRARLSQHSGFDWKDASITISTAVPNLNNDRPVLRPLFADYDHPSSRRYKEEAAIEKNYHFLNMALAKNRDGAALGASDPDNCWDTNKNGVNDAHEDRNGDGEFNSMDCYGAQVQQTELAVEFEVPERRTVKSDGKISSIALSSYALPAEYVYHTVPKLENKAFLVAKIPNWGKYNLMSGPANLFFEDKFIGKSHINSESTSDTLWVSMGRDEGIKVRRGRIAELTEHSFIGFNRKETFAFETEILNNKRSAVTVNILDQIPLTKQQDIEVKLIEKDGAIYTKDYGKISWDLELKPGESKKVKLVYSLKYPKSKRVTLRR